MMARLKHIFILILLSSLLAGPFAQAATWNTFWGNVGVGKTPAAPLDIIGGVNTTGTVNGTSLCIAGVCKTDWLQVSASSTNFWGGTKNGNIWNGDAGAGLVGIGTTAPTSYLHVVATSGPVAVFVNGNVGIGTTAPDQRLSVKGGGIGFDNNSADKKLYSPADGDLEWYTNNAAGVHGFAVSNQGTKLVYLNTSGSSYFNGGNLGIGITNPAFPLETVGMIASKNLSNSNNRHFVMNGFSGLTWDLYGGHGGNSYFGISENQATPYFAIQGGVGNVGIMKTNPAAVLDIVGSLSSSGTVNGTGLCIAGDCKVSWAAIGAAGSGWTRSGSYLYTTALTDNVGVGIATPGAKLQVNGTGLITAAGSARFDLFNTTYNGKYSNYVNDAGTWQLADNANNVKIQVATGANGQIDFYPGSGNTIFNGTGNIGLGASPTEKLDVSGRIRITGNQTLVAGSTGPVLANVTGFGLQLSTLKFGVATNSGTTPNFVVDSGGNVGIGISSPVNKLVTQVAADDRVVINQTTANNYGYQWQYNGTREWDLYANNASGLIQFYSQTAGNVMTLLKSNGNVGILKSNPGTVLDIVGGMNASGTINGTGICIAGDCKASWAAVAAAGSGWNVNGTNVYKSDTNGNTGIGTTAPTAKLAVSGGYIGTDNAQGYTIKDSAGTYRWVMQGTAGNLLNIGDTAGWSSGIAFAPGAAEAMRIISSGLVGIGTTAPTSYLHVVAASGPAAVFMNGNVGLGTTAPTAKLSVYNGAMHVEGVSNGGATLNTNVYAMQLGPLHDRSTTANSYYPGIAFNHLLNYGGGTGYNVAPQAWIGTRLYDTPGSERDSLVFATKPGTGTTGTGNDLPIERMTIDPFGNVGVGVSNPMTKLEVGGNLIIWGSAAAQRGLLTSNATTHDLQIVGGYNNNGGINLQTITGGVTTDRLAIMNGGNVGISKTNPGATLDIVGGLSSTGTVNGTGLCISGDCKASWAAIGAAGSGWTRSGSYLYTTALTDNVGVGIATPGAKLQVNGTGLITAAGSARFDLFNTTYNGKYSNYVNDAGTWQLADNANNVKIQVATGANGQIDFYPGSGNTIFNGTGNIGLGASPTEKLDVSGRIRITGNQTLVAGSTGPVLANVTGFGLQLSTANFGIATNSGTTPNFVVDANGNVGVGMTAPQKKLDVISTANDFVTAAGNTFGIGSWTGIHFGYRENNNLYRKSALVFERRDDAGNGADGTIHFLNNGVNSGANATLADARLSIRSNGNVGISKTNPASTLDVVGGLNSTGTLNGTGLCISGDCKVSWAAIGAASAGWNINGTNVYKSDVNGNVGIGTTAPGAKLHIGLSNQALRIDYNGTDNYYGSLRWAGLQLGNNGENRIVAGRTAAGGNLAFYVNNINDGSDYTVTPDGIRAMNITSAGLVGIGISNPSAYLHVAASSGPAAVFMNGNVGIGTTAPAQKLEVAGAGRFSSEAGGTLLELGQSTTANQKQLIIQNNPTSNYFSFQGLQQGVTNYQHLALEPSGGNVGIAKTNPATNLDIVGGISSSGTVNGTGLCISGDCKASWPAVGAAASGWTISGTNVYKTDTTGNVGIGTTNPGTYKLKVFGDMAVTGTLSTQTGSDFAEEFAVNEPLEPGTVVTMGDLGHKSVRPSEVAYDKTVVGVISDNPSIIAGRIDLEREDSHKVIVAMAGVVSVKVNSDNGSIRRGDLLTSSSLRGYAMKADTQKSGTMIGKALENLNGREGKIKVLIYLQ